MTEEESTAGTPTAPQTKDTEEAPIEERSLPEAPPRTNTAAFSRAAIKQRQASNDRRAGFFLRTLAFAIDSAILTAVGASYLLAGGLAYGFDDLRTIGDGDPVIGALTLIGEAPHVGSAVFLLLFLLVSGYFIYFHGSLGRTPGKALFGLRVVTDTGLPIGYGRALARWAGFILSCVVFGLGVLWTAFSEVQQGLHDKIARTYVERS